MTLLVDESPLSDTPAAVRAFQLRTCAPARSWVIDHGGTIARAFGVATLETTVRKTTMTIGELARRAQVNPRTLRYYERIGGLTPTGRTAAGYRLYTERDAARLAFIQRAQALGLSLTEIAAIIAVRDAGSTPCRHVGAVAQAKVATIDARIAGLRALRGKLTRLTEHANTMEDTCVAGSVICRAVEGTRSDIP